MARGFFRVSWRIRDSYGCPGLGAWPRPRSAVAVCFTNWPAVLNYTRTPLPKADANLALAKDTLDQIQLGQNTIDDAIKSGDLQVERNQQTLPDFMGLLDTYNFWFNIVTP